MAEFTGWIRREGPNVIGEIADEWGWKIQLLGVPGKHDGVPSFIITGTLGEPPAWLRIPAIDDAAYEKEDSST